MKIDIITFYCEKCDDDIKMWGETYDIARDKVLRHFYEHKYPVWRQSSSIENDIPFERYKKVDNLKRKTEFWFRHESNN